MLVSERFNPKFFPAAYTTPYTKPLSGGHPYDVAFRILTYGTLIYLYTEKETQRALLESDESWTTALDESAKVSKRDYWVLL